MLFVMVLACIGCSSQVQVNNAVVSITEMSNLELREKIDYYIACGIKSQVVNMGNYYLNMATLYQNQLIINLLTNKVEK